MSWPYTWCGNVQVNRDAVFTALLLVYNPHHLGCFRNRLSWFLVSVPQHLIYKILLSELQFLEMELGHSIQLPTAASIPD